MEEKSRSTRSSHDAAETPLLCIMTPARVGENQMLQEPNPVRGKENRRTGWKFNHAKNQGFRYCENEVLHGPNPLQPEKACRRLEVSFMPVTKRSRTSQFGFAWRSGSFMRHNRISWRGRS